MKRGPRFISKPYGAGGFMKKIVNGLCVEVPAGFLYLGPGLNGGISSAPECEAVIAAAKEKGLWPQLAAPVMNAQEPIPAPEPEMPRTRAVRIDKLGAGLAANAERDAHGTRIDRL
jgi:hypothetical protein